MIRLIFLLILIIPVLSYSQSVLPLRADTVRIEKINGSAELHLRNDTRDSLGVLTNIGNGRTRFLKSRRFGDTLFIGKDTILNARKVDTLYKDGDSIRFTINGSAYAFLGGGGSFTLYNALGGSGDTLVNADQEIKWLNTGFGISRSATGTTVTHRADTTRSTGLPTYHYTDSVVAAAGGGGINQLTSDVTAGPGSGSQAATIAPNAVTYSKMQNITGKRLLGRDSSTLGLVREILLGTGLSFDSVTHTLNAFAASLFSDTNARIYAGVLRPSSAAGSGQDITWEWLGAGDGHTRYGFTPYIDATSGFTLYFPTADKVVSIVVNPDESLAGSGVVVGPSVQLDKAICFAYAPGVIGSGYLQGNGTSTLTSTMVAGWTVTYMPSIGAILLDNNAVNLDVNAIACVYQGNNQYHAVRLLSALGSYEAGWQIYDAGGNLVNTNFTSDDIFVINGQTGSLFNQLQTQAASGLTLGIYAGTFANYWVIAILSHNPLDPEPTENFTATPTSATTIDLTWDATVRATNYVVMRSINAHYGYTQIYSGATNSYNDTGLTTGTHYYYRVQATAASGTLNNGWFIADATTP